MRFLVAADPLQQIFYSKKFDPPSIKTVTDDAKLLDEHRKDYTLPYPKHFSRDSSATRQVYSFQVVFIFIPSM